MTKYASREIITTRKNFNSISSKVPLPCQVHLGARLKELGSVEIDSLFTAEPAIKCNACWASMNETKLVVSESGFFLCKDLRKCRARRESAKTNKKPRTTNRKRVK